MKKHYSNKKLARKPLITALEPRLLLDGAAVATALEALSDAQLQQDAAQNSALAQHSHALAGIAPTEARAMDPARNGDKKAVVFIDTQVADYQTLLNGMKEGVEVVLLDGSKDGLAQMAAWAGDKSGYDAIHIISHGAEGQIQLGALTLNSLTAASRSADLAAVGASLAAGGDLLVYGCSVASGEGQDFITSLAQLTQADVAASEDVTGAAAKGGDWVLEQHTGAIEASHLSAGFAGTYQHTLATISFIAADADYSATAVTKTVLDNTSTSRTVTFSDDGGDNFLAFDGGGLYALSESSNNNGIELKVTMEAGYSFDLTGVSLLGGSTTVMVSFTRADGSTGGPIAFDSALPLNDVKQVVFTSSDYAVFNDFVINDVKAISANSAPIINNLNGDNKAWPGGTFIFLDDFSGLTGIATVTDAENDGSNWNGGTLTLQRTATGSTSNGAWSADVFAFNSIYFSATAIDATSGTLKFYTQAAGQSFATYTNTNGVLSISFNSNATSEMVGWLFSGISYQNATPAGDASFGFTLTDGAGGSTTATTTVTSDTIYVTNANDTAVIDTSDGISFSEAVAIAAADATGSQAISFSSALAGQTITLAGDLVLNESLTIDAYEATGVSLTGHSITINANNQLAFSNSSDDSLTINSTLAGSGSLATFGDGTLAISGNNTSFTGDVIINSGTISTANIASLGSGGSLTLNGGTLSYTGASATLAHAMTVTNNDGVLNHNGNLTITGQLSGDGMLAKSGSGRLTLSNTGNEATMNGVIKVTAGSLSISDDDQLGSGDLILSGGATLATAASILTIDNGITIESGGATFNQSANGHLTLSGSVAGDALLTKTGAGSLTLSANNEDFAGGVQINSGTLNATSTGESLGYATVTLAGGTLALSGATAINNNIVVDESADATISNSTDVTLSGQISGLGALTKAGAGTMTWSGANTHSGDLIVAAGTLAVSGGSSIGDSSAVTISSGTTLSLAGGGETIGSLSGEGNVALGSYNLTLGGDGSSTVFSGVISGTNSGITKLGSGTFTLSGINTYTGTTTVSAGTLEVSGGSAIANSGAVNVASGATLALNADETIGVLSGAGSVTLGSNTLILGSGGGSGTFSGIISGAGGLSKAGSGTQTLSGNNSYTGATAVTAGTLAVGHANALGTTAGATAVSSGATLQIADGITLAENLSLIGNGVSSSGALLGNGTSTVSGAVDLTGNTRISVASAGSMTLSGGIGGNFTLTKANTGTLSLTGDNSAWGGTISVSAGTLVAGHNNALGNTTGTTSVSSGGALALANGVTIAENITISGLGISNSGALRLDSGSATLNGTVTMSGNSRIGAATGSSLTLSGAIGGSFSLAKTGVGTLILDGASTYTGATTLSDGTLEVNGSLGSTSALATVFGTTLSGTGSIFAHGSGNTLNLVSAATLAPGVAGSNNGVGALTINGNLIMRAGSILAVDIAGTTAGTGYDQVVVNGTVSILSATIAPTLSYTPGNGDAYVIINNDGTDSIFNSFGSLNEGGTINSASTVLALTGSYIGGSDNNDFTLTAPSNNAPIISDLDGDSVAWAGVGNYVTLDAGTALSVADTEFGSLNAGNGNWNGATLTISRVTSSGVADGTTKDLFSFLDNAMFSVDQGSSPYTNYPVQSIEEAQAKGQNATGALSDKALVAAGQDSWFARWSYTYATGTLVVEFGTTSGDGDINVTPTTAQVAAVLQSIGYRNDTPYGDTTIRFSLSDGTTAATADVTVTSDTIYADATSDSDSEGDASDGFSLREALARGVSQGGFDTIKVVLANNSTYTLASDATAGVGDTLDLSAADGVTITGNTLNLAGALTVTADASKTATLSSALAGSGHLMKEGAGTLTLSGTNTHSGAVTVSGGTLAVSGGSAVGDSSAVTVAGGATLALNGNETLGSLAGAGSVTLGNNTLTTGGDNTSTTFSGTASGTGALTKIGSGTLTLSGANSYTGATAVSAGSLALSGGSSISDSSAVTVSSGATLSLNLGGETIGSLAGAGAVSLSYNLSVGDSTDTIFSGVISSTNSSGINKVGSGTLSLTGANTYTGSTTVSAGRLVLENGAAIADSSAVTVNAGAELELRQSEAIGSVTGAGTLTLNGASLTVGGNNGDTTFSGVIQDSGGLTKIGTGTLTLSGSNSYEGTTTVLGGGLSINGDSNLGSGALTLNSGTLSVTGDGANIDNAISLSANGGVVNIGTGVATTLSGIISGTGALTKAGDGRLTLAGVNTFSGSLSVTDGTLAFGANNNISSTSGLTLNGGSLASTATVSYSKAITVGANGGTLDISSGSMTLSGVISGSGHLTSTSSNAGNALTLSGINTYTGGTTLKSGILQFNNDNAVGSGTLTIEGGKVRASAARTVSNDLVLGGTMTMSGSNAMTFTGNVNLGGADRTIDNSISSDLTFSGIISNGSMTIGGGAATGAVVLSGNNTHTNTTIIGSNSSGNINTLSVASDASLGSGSITLNGAGAVLKVTGATTIDNALSIGSSGGKIENSAAATLSGVVSGSGAFTKAGAGTLTLSGTNTHTGAVTVSAGTLALTDGSSIGDSSAVTVDSGATLSLTGGGETIGSLSGAGAVSLSYTLTVGDSTSTIFSGVISSTNTSGITKVGSGTLTLSGANTYTGSTTISAGGLTLNKSGGALSDTTAVTVASGATLTVSINDTIGSLAGAGTVALGSSLLTFGSNNTSTTFSGSITGASGGSIKKLGSGTLTLSGTNSYVGGTDLTGGTLVVSSVGALGSGGISFSAGTTLDLAASGTFANYIDLAADATIHVGSGVSATLSNTIDGNGNLTKSGSGTLSLSGSQSATGTMLVSAGTVSVAGDENLLAGSLTLNGGTLSISGASTIDNSIILGSNGGFVTNSDLVTLSGVISGTGDFSKAGAGTLTLSGTQTATGAMLVSAGTLAVAGDGNLLAGSLTLNGGSLSITGTTTIDNAVHLGSIGAAISTSAVATLSGIISGAGDLRKEGSGTLTLSGTQTGTGGVTIDSGALAVAGDANLLAGSLTLNGGTLSVTTTGTIDNAINLGSAGGAVSHTAAVTLSGIISGAGDLSKSGNGTLTLTGMQTGIGGLTVSAGTLSVANDANLLAGSLTLNGGTLSVTGSGVTIDNAVVLGSNNGTITNASAMTLSGVISGSGNFSKSGAGALTLSGTNTYTGTSTFAGGTVNISSDSNLGSGDVILGTNGNFTITGTTTIDNNIILNAAPAVISVSTGATATISGVISETGGNRGLNKGGSGTLILGANATYTGGTALNGGVFQLAATTTMATSGITLNNSSPTLKLTGEGTFATAIIIRGNGTNSISVDDAVTLSGLVSLSNDQTANRTLTKTGSGTLTLSNTGNSAAGAVTAGANTYQSLLTIAAGTVAVATDANLVAGTVTLSGGSLAVTGATTIDNAIVISSAGTISSSDAATLSGVISGSSTLNKAGAGVLTFSGNNTHTGAINIADGVLAVTSGNAIGDNSAVTVASGAKLHLYLADETIGSLSGAGIATLNGGTLTVGGNNTSTTFSGAIEDQESGSLVKAGAGTFTLSGTSTYTGATAVNAGTLNILGALSATSGISVLSGATLTGTGSVFTPGANSTLTVNQGALLAPAGSGTGVLTVNGNLTLNGTLKADITGPTAGSQYDQVLVTGAVALGTNSAFDINYAGSGTDNSYVLIDNDASDAVTGTLNGVADYGLLPAHSADFQIRYQGGTGNDVTLTLNSAPVLTSGTTGNVAENAATNTVIYAATATDANNNTLTYSLTGQDANLLTIDALTGEVRLKSPADYETKASYSFTLVVTDSGNLTARQAVTVSVTNVNEAPVLTSGTTANLDENAATSIVIYTATATDVDNNTLTYSLSGTDANLLTIDAVTGEVRLKNAADYESKTSYSFIVTASDSGNLSSSQAVTVNVNDLNDNTAVITSGATGSVNENAATSTVIYTVVASDADGSSAYNTLTYSLSGADADLLMIDAVSGEVRLKATADYEAKTSYSFIVTASDSGNLSSSQAVTVSVIDLNDNTAVITSGATGSVNENAATSTVIYTVIASDADGTSAHNTLTYSLSGTDAELLTIDAVTGEVRLKAAADYESKTSYSFIVTASDSGNLSSSQAVTVNVNDLNDNTAVITSGATGSVNENAATSTVIYTVVASDADGSSAYNTLTYSLSGADADLLMIDAVSGEVRLKAAADYEAKTSYSFIVTASDSGNLSSSQAVTVSVNDLNDNTAVITSGATGSVNENAATSTVIYTVIASDADGTSAHNTLTYSLSGTDAELLTIDAVTGEVRLKAAADYESKTSYSFIVTASDSGNLSSSQAVTVNVNDLNDNIAVITSGATGSVNENAATSTVIYTVVASDADGSSAYNTLTYSLSGADADLLMIDAVSGEVRLKAAADYEAKTSYSFIVTASDSGNLSSSQAVTVSVIDLNDNTAVITSGATGSVNENAATTTVIYTAAATDNDGTSAHNTLTYSLSGTDAELLTIDAVTGEVRLKAAADYESKTSYSFIVTASDSGNLSSSQAVTVNVLDLNDNAPSLSAGASSATLVEAGGVNNTTVGTATAIITLTAADIDTVGSVLYDRTFLLENGWSTADAGATYSKAGTYGTASFTVESGVLSYRLNNSDSVTQALIADQAVNESFVIQVTDGNASAQTTAVFNLLGSNDAPTVVGSVAPMAGILGQVFNPVSLPETLFTDVDATESRQLQWSVENLPAGLVFDAGTRTIAGTLGGNVTGAVTLQLVATDPNGAQVRTAVVMNIEPAPVINLVVAPPVSVVAPVSQVITSSALEVPTLTFSSLPEGTLSTSSGASGFAAAPGQASPIQGLNDAPPAVSNAVVVNVAADGQVQISQAGADLANSGSLTVANMQIQTGQLSIQLADSVGAASYSATLADGSQLPDWVSVNPVTGEVTMTPPPGQGKITLRINAVDANGTVRVLEVEVDLENLPAAGAVEPAPVNAPVDTVAAFMPLAQQLNIAAAQTDDYGIDLMKLLAS